MSGTNFPNGIALADTNVTATAAELNALDGITSTVTELNLLDGYVAATLDTRAISVPINATANATNTFGIMAVARATTITGIRVAFHAIPASTMGTVTLAVTNYDLSATTDDNLLNAATFDLEGLVAKNATALTLTGTGADLVLAAGDFVFCQVVSNNADMTGGTGGVITVEFTIK